MLNLDEYSPKILSIVRVIAALLFVEHALMKLVQFPAALPGAPTPLPSMLLAAALIELVSGALMTAGLFTRTAAFFAAGEMAVAYFTVHAPQSFWPALNQGDAAILFCFVFLYFVFAGGGAWSLDALRRNRSLTSGRAQ